MNILFFLFFYFLIGTECVLIFDLTNFKDDQSDPIDL